MKVKKYHFGQDGGKGTLTMHVGLFKDSQHFQYQVYLDVTPSLSQNCLIRTETSSQSVFWS